jgi:hypothetical protein
MSPPDIRLHSPVLLRCFPVPPKKLAAGLATGTRAQGISVKQCGEGRLQFAANRMRLPLPAAHEIALLALILNPKIERTVFLNLHK